MREYLQRHTNPPVFLISGAVVLIVLAFGVIFPVGFGKFANDLLGWITTYFGWFYIISVSFFLIFVVWLMFTKWGNIRLGPDESRPRYGTISWFAMLFTAGMGIGLVYYGVAEPISHFNSPPTGKGGTEAAATHAMNYTFYHWGLHPWAVYIVLGLSIAYFHFRKGLPIKPASAFYPLIGDRIYGPIGHAIDILAVFGTIFGLATSIGIGAQQIGSGLHTLFAVPDSTFVQVIIIGVVEVVAIGSIMLGIDAGIRRLANINMWLAVLLCAFVFLVGPTLYLLQSLAGNIGYYAQNLIGTSFTIFSSGKGADWQSSWTLFYWGWWISWSPFVGMFIARISYGRTIRQFIVGALLAPTGASFVWFVVFGDTGLHNLLTGGGDKALANADSSNALFVLLQQLPVTGIITVIASVLGIIVVTLFFATSSDSGSLVVDMLTNGGDPNPIWQQRLFWAIMEGVVAAVLLIAGAAVGGDPLSALQAASVSAGLPFCFVLLVMCFSLVKALQQENVHSSVPEPRSAPEPGRAMSRPRGTPAPQRASAENPQDREQFRG